MNLQRVVITFGQDGIQLRTLETLDGGDVADLSTSGLTPREDILGLPLASSDSAKQMKKGA